MEDLASKLSALLESPEGLERVKSLAGMIMQGGDSAAPERERARDGEESGGFGGGIGNALAALTGGDGAPSGAEMQMMMKAVGLLRRFSVADDKNTRLLLALRPHLSEERQGRVDTALQIIKLLSVMPLLTEGGIL